MYNTVYTFYIKPNNQILFLWIFPSLHVPRSCFVFKTNSGSRRSVVGKKICNVWTNFRNKKEINY
jgi:hypothetical protein